MAQVLHRFVNTSVYLIRSEQLFYLNGFRLWHASFWQLMDQKQDTFQIVITDVKIVFAASWWFWIEMLFRFHRGRRLTFWGVGLIELLGRFQQRFFSLPITPLLLYLRSMAPTIDKGLTQSTRNSWWKWCSSTTRLYLVLPISGLIFSVHFCFDRCLFKLKWYILPIHTQCFRSRRKSTECIHRVPP